MNKTNKRTYSVPLVLQRVELLLERDILLGPSTVDHMAEIKATGQELDTYDFSENSSFNHTWEEE